MTRNDKMFFTVALIVLAIISLASCYGIKPNVDLAIEKFIAILGGLLVVLFVCLFLNGESVRNYLHNLLKILSGKKD